MFAKKPSAQLEMPNTVIGKGITLEAAVLTGKESVRIDGLFRGNIDIDGSLILGDSGNVIGDIHAKYIVIAGRVNGNVKCDSVLHFSSTARVVGDIESVSIIVDEGGQLNGRYQIGELPREADKPAEKSYLDKSLEITENRIVPVRNRESETADNN